MNNNLVLIVLAFGIWILLWIFRWRIDEWFDKATFRFRAYFLFRKYFSFWAESDPQLRPSQLSKVIKPTLFDLAVDLRLAYEDEHTLLQKISTNSVEYQEAKKGLLKVRKTEKAASDKFYEAARVARQMGFEVPTSYRDWV